MNKPSDIPQDVWAIATEIVADLECERVPYYDMSGAIAVARHNDTLSISNAILKARQDAFDQCERKAREKVIVMMVDGVGAEVAMAEIYGNNSAAREIAADILSLSQPQKAEQE